MYPFIRPKYGVVKRALFTLVLITSACERDSDQAPQENQKNVYLDLDALPGWQAASLKNAFDAFFRSCNNGKRLKPDGYEAICKKISLQTFKNDDERRAFLTEHFVAKSQDFNRRKQGLATGYYQPHLEVAEDHSKEYPYPIYARPKNLIIIENLGKFNPRAKGIRISGIVKDQTLVPFISRAEIEQQPHLDQADVIAYAKNKVDLFFMQIQGSGKLVYPSGKFQQICYDGSNGYPYRAIGGYMLQERIITADQLSMQGIKGALMKLTADQINQILNTNQSYVFFKPTKNTEHPFGAEGVELTPMASLAVDPEHIPLGTFVWFDAQHPTKESEKLQQLTVAQDVGGAIKGPNRADYYWGSGARAGHHAGLMKSPLDLYVLIPKSILSLGSDQ